MNPPNQTSPPVYGSTNIFIDNAEQPPAAPSNIYDLQALPPDAVQYHVPVPLGRDTIGLAGYARPTVDGRLTPVVDPHAFGMEAATWLLSIWRATFAGTHVLFFILVYFYAVCADISPSISASRALSMALGPFVSWSPFFSSAWSRSGFPVNCSPFRYPHAQRSPPISCARAFHLHAFPILYIERKYYPTGQITCSGDSRPRWRTSHTRK